MTIAEAVFGSVAIICLTIGFVYWIKGGGTE